MSLNVLSNYAANVAHRFLTKSDGEATRSLSRLSAGTRVLNGSDDAAALALGTQIRTDVVSLKQAAVNVGQATSMLQIADGGMGTVTDILVRMKSLATQSASDQVGASQRAMIQSEFHALQAEISRVANTTNFDGKKLIDGSLVSAGLKFQVGAGNVADQDTITVQVADMRASAIGSDGTRLGNAPVTAAAGSQAVVAANVGTVAAPSNGTNVTTLGAAPVTVQAGQQARASVQKVTGIVVTDAGDLTSTGFTMSLNVQGTVQALGDVDLSSAADLAGVVTAINGKLADKTSWKVGGAQTVSASAVDGVLILTDTQGRAMSNIAIVPASGRDAAGDNIAGAAGTATVVDAGQTLVESVTQITRLDAATLPNNPASKFKIKVGNNIQTEVELSSSANLTAIASAIQTGLRTAANAVMGSDGTALGVTQANGVLTIHDAKGRTISGVELVASQAGIEANSTESVQNITGLASSFAAGYVGKLTMTVGGVTTSVTSGVPTATTGAGLATAIQTALQSAIDTSVTASFSGGTLTIKDKQGRAISGTSLVDNTGAAAVASTTTIGGISAGFAAGAAYALDVTVGSTRVARIDLRSVAAGSLATTVQSAMQTAIDGSVTAVFSGGTLTLADARGRGISGVNLIATQDNKVSDLSVSSYDNAFAGISVINDALDDVAKARAEVGALQNRLDYAAQNLATQTENMEAARSNLMDLDMAAEMSLYTSKQILQQAGISMLAQAQRMPQNLLRLFQ